MLNTPMRFVQLTRVDRTGPESLTGTHTVSSWICSAQAWLVPRSARKQPCIRPMFLVQPEISFFFFDSNPDFDYRTFFFPPFVFSGPHL